MTGDLNRVFHEICELLNLGGGEFILWNLENEMEEVMDSTVRQSPLIRIPEEQPKYWKVYREKLSSSDIDILNHYYTKFGLPPVEIKEKKIADEQSAI